LIEEAESVMVTLQALRQAGVRIHLDDFGMGYSSLSYLHRFPMDALKIDRSFVSVPGQPGIVNRSIVAAIVALAHTLGITVTAEGIETPTQQAELEALTCEHGQGFRFSMPVTTRCVMQLLEHEMARPFNDVAGQVGATPI
jgi:EAL domain-containing protein (putative c-di-GMP-specific phosphodiesterase class I)